MAKERDSNIRAGWRWMSRHATLLGVFVSLGASIYAARTAYDAKATLEAQTRIADTSDWVAHQQIALVEKELQAIERSADASERSAAAGERAANAAEVSARAAVQMAHLSSRR